MAELQEPMERCLQAIDLLLNQNRELFTKIADIESRLPVKAEVLNRSVTGSAKKPFGGKSQEEQEHNQNDCGYSSDDDEDEEDSRIRGKLKAVLVTVLPHKGGQVDHSVFIGKLKTAFKLYGMKQIVGDEENWIRFRTKNKDKAKLQEKVLIATLESVLMKGTVYNKYLLAKRQNERDGRGMFLAVRDAHHLSTSKLTVKGMKRELKELSWNDQEDYDNFIEQFNEKCDAFSGLKDKHGDSVAITEDDRVELLMDKFKDSQTILPVEQQTWQLIFDSAELTYEQTDTELTLDALYAIIRPKIESAKRSTKEGMVHQQTGRDMRKMKCWSCNELGHMSGNCPNPGKSNGDRVCSMYLKGKCNYGNRCKWKHESGDGAGAAGGGTMPPGVAASPTTMTIFTGDDKESTGSTDYEKFLQFQKFQQQQEKGKSAVQNGSGTNIFDERGLSSVGIDW
jgi:hypothetical protein